MKNLYLAILLFAGQMIWAQVGINTANPNAQLDIRSSSQTVPANTDGILIPKIDVFPAVNPTAAQQGMMVYLTTLASGNSPGFYYWNNPTTSWLGISASSGNWLLKGNAGTSPSTQFLGTTDNVDLAIRTNNVENIRVKNDGRVEIGNNGTNPTYLGQTSTSKKLFVASSTVSNNIVFQSSTASADPLSIYIGNSRGSVATPSASQNGDQISNIFFSGYDGAKFLNAAGITCNIDGGVITDTMNGSLAFSTTQNGQFPAARMMIRSNGNIGMGTSTPLDKLHIIGNIRMVDGNQAAGKVLTSDANGTASWQNPLTIAQTWGLTGNSGTTSATNFLGTTDDVDLVFKRFNIRGGFIGTTNTSFGLTALNPASTGTNITAIGSNALDANTNGNDNVATGFNALTSNTGGDNNTAIGTAAMVSNLNGDSNTAIGRSALFDNTASNNTAVGFFALGNVTTGTNNTSVGANAFTAFNSGSNNTSIGAETSSLSTIYDNATAIGYKATVGNSNVMVLGSINGINGATSSVNVGIGTTSPQTALEVTDGNVVTSATVEGNINVLTNGPQTIDSGGSLTLGGTVNDAGTLYRSFGSIEARKATATTNSSTGYLLFKTNNTGTLAERMRITNLGDVGIGTATPGGQFELSLNEGRKPGSTVWTMTSDARLKTVSGDFTMGLNEIKQLHPIRYHYKNVGKHTFEPEVLATEFSGFLAQDVQKIFPNCVTTDSDGYLSLNVHDILIASVNALKELDAKNEKLEQENQELKAKLKLHDEQLAKILAELEKRK